tara:strand:- start:38 stop:211 length:174 start_codon:yes stop_codon:yes gene_type:complete
MMRFTYNLKGKKMNIIKVMKQVEEFIMGSVDKRSGDDRRVKKPRKRKNEKRIINRRK